VLNSLTLPGWEDGSAVVLVGVAVTIWPGASGVTLAPKLAFPEPSVVAFVDPTGVWPSP
jgi:hypothetical protein